MKVRLFNFWKANRELEANVIGQKWNLRIGTHQVALWRSDVPIFNLTRKR